ncbi:MAG: FAD-binding oxidoreductase [Caldisphaeraceae archaeon]|nr:FAD-binding oxidoreductase [Caldisphaeraceae archaeon]MEB3692327.1 FAD-binding oxidoreductase [Caldisphaeraceae archaeon]MEB3798250.1 FAD-binding oxidoreductase [Caldisphaeraceae archaeon]
MPDYIVVGAGIVGLATAYHLALEDRGSSILVVDKADGPGGGDTSKSAAAFRTAFTSKVNIMLSKTSISFYESIEKKEKFDLGMKKIGYLLALGRKWYNSILDGIRVAEKMGVRLTEVDSSLLDRIHMERYVSNTEEGSLMEAEDIYKSYLFLDAGILDPEKLVDYYYNKLRSLGVNFSFGDGIRDFILEAKEPLGIEGEPFPWEDIKVKGVLLNNGQTVRAKKKVIAAMGAWSNLYLNKIGIDSYSRPKKRQIFSIKADRKDLKDLLFVDGFNEEKVMPFTILPKGVYIRPNPSEGTFWTGLSDELNRPIEVEEEPLPEENYYVYGILPVLSLYFKQYRDVYPYSSWAGHYDISFDGQPVIYEPFNSNLVVSAGTSGSGIMKGDAIGRITAAVSMDKEVAMLYDGVEFKTHWLGLDKRVIDKELLIF